MMDGERSRSPYPDGTRDGITGPPLYRRVRGDLEMSTSRPAWLDRLEAQMVQPPVRMSLLERIGRWMLGR